MDNCFTIFHDLPSQNPVVHTGDDIEFICIVQFEHHYNEKLRGQVNHLFLLL